jgi:hypothetical protein
MNIIWSWVPASVTIANSQFVSGAGTPQPSKYPWLATLDEIIRAKDIASSRPGVGSAMGCGGCISRIHRVRGFGGRGSSSSDSSHLLERSGSKSSGLSGGGGQTGNVVSVHD